MTLPQMNKLAALYDCTVEAGREWPHFTTYIFAVTKTGRKNIGSWDTVHSMSREELQKALEQATGVTLKSWWQATPEVQG